MRIKTFDGCCAIYPQSNLEELLIDSNYLKSKLAYTKLNYYHNSFGNIEFNKNKPFLFELEKNKFNINIEEENKIRYLLRIIVDSMCINENTLPLHSAYGQLNKLGILLFGDMYAGKSLTLKSLKNLDNINLIGDDHILIGKKRISGNILSRIRTKQKDIFFPLEGTCKKTDNYIIFNLYPSNINSIDYSKKDEYLKDKNLLNGVLKYLNKNPKINGIKYDLSNIIGKTILEKYFSLYKNFIEKSDFIIKITGEHEYITEKVKEIITNQ